MDDEFATDPTVLRNPTGLAYEPDVKELAFELWALECQRNQARTLRRLAEELPGRPVPHPNTLRNWIKGERWDLRADERIASIAPHLAARQVERLFLQTNAAQDLYDAVLAGELDRLSPGVLMAKIQVAKDVLALRGLGTASVKGGAPELPKPAAAEDEGQYSTQELARMQAERLRQHRR